MREALVTGAAGFIGSHVVCELLRLPEMHVVAMDDLSGGFRENLPSEVDFVEGSVTDPALVSSLFEQYRFDYVYHLAAYAAEGLSHFIRRYNYETNLVGSVNLINAAVNHDVKCFVFTSSIAVYGAKQVPMREDMVPQPEDPYGVAKYAVEQDLRAAYELFGLNYVVFRPHNVYGECQNIGDKYRNVVGIFMNQIVQNRPMTVFGDGEQQRAFSYVRDITRPIVQAAWNPAAYQKVFNIGGDETHSVNELARAVAGAMGAPGHPIEHLPPRNEVRLAFSDHNAATAVFGPPTVTPLATGLRRMANWVRRVGARDTPKFAGIEIDKNMPPSWKS